jgi:hypothetical protein
LRLNDTRGVGPDQEVHVGQRRAKVNTVADVSWQTRLTGWVAAAWQFVRTAPLTYLWLAVLAGTTIRQHFAGRHLHHLLMHESTNIRDLAINPVRVLFESLLWTDGGSWALYLFLFTLFLAPAEHWLGQIRWLIVGLAAHVGATYISEGWLYLAIQYHHEPERLVHATDIGVSYFLVGMIAVLAYRIPRPWRWGYLAVLIGIFVFLLITQFNFTAIGHFSAIFIGLMWYPLTQSRPATSNQPVPASRDT